MRKSNVLKMQISINKIMKYKGIAIDSISLVKTPWIYGQLVLYILQDAARWVKELVIKRCIPLALLVVGWMVVCNVAFLHVVQEFAWFAGYWIILGIASSIGLGTGLHTFVLYLGPHIAKVAIIATSCGHLPPMIPSRWSFDHFEKCSVDSTENIGFFGILLAVQIQSFLWGFGTAIGELPPYFVAKKASDTRAELKRMNRENDQKKHIEQEEQKFIEKQKKTHHISNEEIEQIYELKQQKNLSLMDRAKIIIYDNMQKYGFWTILACASIPNPLFDLAGITCGHFRIPFKTFFSATFIGKAIIKVHIQMLFVITIFRKSTIQYILSLIAKISTSFSQTLLKGLESQKISLQEPSTFKENKPLIAKIWDIFIIGMVGYFLFSIINGQVQEKAIELKDKN